MEKVRYLEVSNYFERMFGKIYKSRAFTVSIKILVTTSAIVWLVTRVRWNVISDEIENINLAILILSLFIFLSQIAPCALRWRRITNSCGYPISARESTYYYLIGSFFNAFLPTGRGGDVARGIYAARHHGFSLGGILGTIFVERYIGFITALLLVSITSLFVISKNVMFGNVLSSVFKLTLVLLVLLVLLTRPAFQRLFKGLIKNTPFLKLQTGIDNAIDVLNMCWKNVRLLFATAGYSILIQLIFILAGFVIGLAIKGFRAPWYSFPIVIPLVFVAGLIPSIGGYGVREAGYVIFFGWFGVNDEEALLFGILQLMFLWAFSFIGAFAFLFIKSRK